MKHRFLALFVVIFTTTLFTACTSASEPENVMEDKVEVAPDPMSEEDTAPVDDGMADDGMMEDDADASEPDPVISPDWFMASMTNVQSGENFAIVDHSGKVILVETLAMWCSKCLQQQGQVRELHSLLGEREDFVSIGLDIDPNENADALKSYVANNGFDWVYSIAPVEVAREIGQLYGSQFLNPPSTPMLIIDRHGEVHILPFGIKSAQELLAYLEPFLNESM
ncbi:MAG: hypothetical protein OEV06_05040 [Anaerolineae bacterium]|nr:hypothetical protein [Anaerolineae bacterium]